jgi:hypothetical protein
VTREPSDVIRRLDGSNWRFEVTEELPMSPDDVYLGVARRADS